MNNLDLWLYTYYSRWQLNERTFLRIGQETDGSPDTDHSEWEQNEMPLGKRHTHLEFAELFLFVHKRDSACHAAIEKWLMYSTKAPPNEQNWEKKHYGQLILIVFSFKNSSYPRHKWSNTWVANRSMTLGQARVGSAFPILPTFMFQPDFQSFYSDIIIMSSWF